MPAHHRPRVQAPRAPVRLAQHHRPARALRVPELEPPGEEEPPPEEREHQDNHQRPQLAEVVAAATCARGNWLLPGNRVNDEEDLFATLRGRGLKGDLWRYLARLGFKL